MKALIFDPSHTDWDSSVGFEKHDVPKPVLDETANQADAHNVLVKVHYAGVCGSDRGIWYRQSFKEQILGTVAEQKDQPYRIIGHEFFGEIVEMGSEAKKNYSLAVGDFVSAESHVVCNECYQCKIGQKNVCTNEKILGISHDGCFAEYIKLPAHIVWKTDTAKIRPEVAAMQEPFGNAVHAASKVDLKGKSVAIFGLGPIGLFLVLVARGLGAEYIIGIEPNPKAQDMARALGIDYVLDPGKSDPNRPFAHNPELAAEIMKVTNGVGVDVSFEMSGFNSSMNNCLYATRRGGDVVLFGIKSGDFTIEDYNRLIVRGYTLHAVIGREVFQTWEITRKLLEDTSNGIQEKMYTIILQQGNGTIMNIDDYSKDIFEKKMVENPKFLVQF